MLRLTRDASVAEIAYAKNETGVVDVLNAALTDVTGLVFTLPQVGQPVYIKARILVDVTAAPAASSSGDVNLTIVDDTGTPLEQSIMPIEPGGTNGYIDVKVEARLDPNTPSRTYRAQASRSGNATFTGQILHGSLSPVFRSWMRALKA